MPVMILHIIDEDIFTEPELYLPSEIEKQLCWIFSIIDENVKLCKIALPKRSMNFGEPLQYVAKSIPRFDNGTDPSYLIFADRLEKYNTLLQAIARCYAIGTVNMQTLTLDDSRLFDRKSGKTLDTTGYYKYWH